MIGGAVWGGVGDERGEFGVWDVTDNSVISVQWVQGTEGTTTRLEDGTQIFSPEVVEWFRSAESVYYVRWESWAVALGPDFKTHPENNYILASRRSGQYWDPESILTFLNDNHIAYIEVDKEFFSGSAGPSHDGRFIARFDGFFTSDGQEIGPLYDSIAYLVGSPVAYGWAYDDSGVYVQYLEGGTLWIFPQLPRKKQPILKINLPIEYLSPEARASEETRWEQEQRESLQRVAFWIILTIVTAGLVAFWRLRKHKNTKEVAL
jgi:hypothetical protein